MENKQPKDKKKEQNIREIQSDYTENELKKFIAEDTKKGKLEWLYKEYYVSHKRKPIKDNKNIKIYDYIAKQLLELDDNLEDYFKENISEIDREKRLKDKNKIYTPIDHNIKEEKEKAEAQKKDALSQNKPFDEEPLAKTLLEEEFDYIGKIINYQIPINDEQDDGAGRIDLLAYNEDKKIISLIELKKRENKETILRAILEICTYYYQIKKDVLVKEYTNLSLSEIEIWKVVLIYKDSKQHEDFINSENIRTLARRLNIKILLLDNNNNITPLAL